MSRAGLMQHWAAFQDRDGAEAGTSGTDITYTTITKMRVNVTNQTGQQLVSKRGADQENTHLIEVRRVPDLSKSNYVLILQGPFANQRFKVDSNRVERKGRRIYLRGYAVGDAGAFVNPDKGTLPELF